MAVEGTLDVFRLPEIFQVISHQRKTGILTVQGENDIVAVSFLDGSVVAADALNQTIEETIGGILQSNGMVDAERFDEIAAEAREGDGRLLDLLVGRGLIDREGLLAALRSHTYGLLFQLLGWDSGGFKFYSGDEVAYEDGFQPIPVEELLLRAIAEGEEEGSEALPEQGLLYGRVEPPPCEIRERIGPPRPGEDADGNLWVSSDELAVWNLLAVPQTVDGLVAACRLGEHKVRFALYRFLAAGVAEVHEDESDEPLAPLADPPELPRPGLPGDRASGQRSGRSGDDTTWSESTWDESTWGERTWDEPTDPGRPLRPTVEMPDPVLDPFELPEPPTRRSWLGGERSAPGVAGTGSMVLGHLLAFLLVVAVGSGLWSAASDFLMPFPWLVTERSADESLRFDGTAARIDRAAKTYYLLEGSFPDSLGRLAALGLLTPLDQRAPGGGAIAYAPDEDSYGLQPADVGGDEPADWAASESVSGNFLLDSEFTAMGESKQARPLVLLD